MKEKNILKISLFCSIIGVSILFLGINLMEVNKVNIEDIKEEDIGKLVSVEGKIKSKYYNGEHLFFDLEDETDEIKIVVFENIIKKLKIEPDKIRNGKEIFVSGEVEKYEGELEIIPNKIRLN